MGSIDYPIEPRTLEKTGGPYNQTYSQVDSEQLPLIVLRTISRSSSDQSGANRERVADQSVSRNSRTSSASENSAAPRRL
jgi:hypothetical protein